MYVCLCKGVTDKQILRAIEEGADSMRQLNRCLGVASQCGKCARQAKDILRDATRSGIDNQMILV
ncbi:MAG TPA: bacterioferritin-associated ferredoxin, partial [Pseudomonadales bacterium]|nr:bacterioferritin-associated ferredoxin [Pseudomonadales bacterium]